MRSSGQRQHTVHTFDECVICADEGRNPIVWGTRIWDEPTTEPTVFLCDFGHTTVMED
jgi:hypothetical protein